MQAGFINLYKSIGYGRKEKEKNKKRKDFNA